MDTPKSNPQLRLPIHGRTASGDERRRVAMPRRATKGPLDADADDPPAIRAPLPPSPPTLSPPPDPSPPAAAAASPSPPPLDLSILQRASSYAPLPPAPTPPSHPPSAPADAPLAALLRAGRFRAAAARAAAELPGTPPADAPRILALFHARLACLALAGLAALAAREAALLGDVNGPAWRRPAGPDGSAASVLPWDLRVLCARLRARGAADARLALAPLYELAREARGAVLLRRGGAGAGAGGGLRQEQEQEEGDEEGGEALWRARLRDLGVAVADALVEAGDVEGAARHLATLGDAAAAAGAGAGAGAGDGAVERLRLMEALAWLRVGDVAAARRCLDCGAGDDEAGRAGRALAALAETADGEYDGAARAWARLRAAAPGDALAAQNAAVCLLYAGHMAEARDALESLVDGGAAFRALLFNLATVYELCTERARERKLLLAGRVAAREPGEGGWERADADFKL